MDKRWATVTFIVLLLVFAGYIVIDVTLRKNVIQNNHPVASGDANSPDKWIVDKVFAPGKGQLNVVAVSERGEIILGGEPFIACYDKDFNFLWEYKTDMPVTALTISDNKIYAAVQKIILVLNINGAKIEEWGPYEDNSMITSLSSNNTYVAFADAANKRVYVLDKKGVVRYLIGKPEEPFIIPSGYFDIELRTDNTLYAANTGKRRIEKRNLDGTVLDYFGEPGTDPGAFCGCCNPAHFALIPDGFITSEKGINRIKILDRKGDFIEFVSSVNHFVPALPLDIASPDGKIIYGASRADSKLYVFRRK